MLAELTQYPLVTAGAAFLLGWIVASISTRLLDRKKALQRDPRDIRIRSLEAEGRVAQAEIDKLKSEMERLESESKELVPGIEQRDNVITELQAKIDQLRLDLKASVKKTRELRAELTERATENMQAEAKIREVETELSIVQASTDLISTGVLEYTYGDEQEDEDDTAELRELQSAKSTR
jgi:chromosome segregation ATPase